MYLIINETQYDDVWLSESTGVSVSYTGASLTGIESVDSIDAYADSGYYLRTDFANDYARVVLRDGEVTLTNRPEPVPVPAPETPREQLSERIADLEAKNEMLEECLIELANIIFA